jgi:hypothetical protein
VATTTEECAALDLPRECSATIWMAASILIVAEHVRRFRALAMEKSVSMTCPSSVENSGTRKGEYPPLRPEIGRSRNRTFSTTLARRLRSHWRALLTLHAFAVPKAWRSSRNQTLAEVAGTSTDQCKSLPVV